MSRFVEIMATYDTIHRAPLNRASHAVGIPLIMIAVIGAASYLHLPGGGYWDYASLASLLVAATVAIVLSWSVPAGCAYLVLTLVCCAGAHAITSGLSATAAAATLFAAFMLGWMFQFAGHAAEGKSPEFVKRPANLLLGPVMIMAEMMTGIRPHAPGALPIAQTMDMTTTALPFAPRVAAVARHLGRVMLAMLFILAGLAKIVDARPFIEHMQRFDVPTFLLPAVIALELGAGLALAFGYRSREAAGALSFFCILTALIFHCGLHDKVERSTFFKDLAIAGGLMALSMQPARAVVVKRLE